MKKINIKNLFKKKTHFRKGGFHANPNIGWELILVLALGIIAGLFVMSAYIFRQTNAEFNAPISGLPPSTASIREERLQNTLEIFSGREQRSREILSFPAGVSDPSL